MMKNNMEKIENIWFEDERIYMLSSKDKVYSRPLEVFPALKEASDGDRKMFLLEMRGEAVRWPLLDVDIHITSFYDGTEPQYNNEVARIFANFPQLNVSEVARKMGINKSLLSKYIYGIKNPSPQRMEQIKSSLHSLGRQLIAV